MATLFPREEKAELLFDRILENPRACRRLMDTFYEALNTGEDDIEGGLSAEQFTCGLLRAYKERDLSSFLMTICGNSMFDLLRNAFLAPFRFNQDGKPNPILLTDDDGKLLHNTPVKVSGKDYERFQAVYTKEGKSRMYLAYGYRKKHRYDEDTMEVVEEKMGAHIGVLMIYELPDTVKKQETEAQAYAEVWNIMMKLQEKLPRSLVYYGQDALEDKGEKYDELGVFLPIHKFYKLLEKSIEEADRIIKES